MPRYNITLFYPNGSSSHQLVTTNMHKARAWTIQILQNDDLRELACRLLVRYGARVLFDAPPSVVPFENCQGAIPWPESKAPVKYKDYTRATVSLPATLIEAARKDGKGNLSKGLLTALLQVYPDLKGSALKFHD